MPAIDKLARPTFAEAANLIERALAGATPQQSSFGRSRFRIVPAGCGQYRFLGQREIVGPWWPGTRISKLIPLEKDPKISRVKWVQITMKEVQTRDRGPIQVESGVHVTPDLHHSVSIPALTL